MTPLAPIIIAAVLGALLGWAVWESVVAGWWR